MSQISSVPAFQSSPSTSISQSGTATTEYVPILRAKGNIAITTDLTISGSYLASAYVTHTTLYSPDPPVAFSATVVVPIPPTSNSVSSRQGSSSMVSPSEPAKIISPKTSSTSATSLVSPTQSTISLNKSWSNGAVAGIVLGVALALSVSTFMATFLCLRRRQHGLNHSTHNDGEASATKAFNMVKSSKNGSDPKSPLLAGHSDKAALRQHNPPESADDNALSHKVSTCFSQLELHVENFYRATTSSPIANANPKLDIFDCPFLPAPVARLIPQIRDIRPMMKHVLTYAVVVSITSHMQSRWTLLPDDFVILPRLLSSQKPDQSGTDIEPSLSQWRTLTARLRPNPSHDTSYIAKRDRHIDDFAKIFGDAFAPWEKIGQQDEKRLANLKAILEHAADLGILLFSQRAELQFRWQQGDAEQAADAITTSPGLVKVADEEGRKLTEPVVLVNLTVQKLAK